MKYPQMRTELMTHIRNLSDFKHQNETWRVSDGAFNEMDDAIHFIYDDSSLASDPLKAMGWFLRDQAEVYAIKQLVSALDHVLDTHGLDLDSASYIETEEWKGVVVAAIELNELLSR